MRPIPRRAALLAPTLLAAPALAQAPDWTPHQPVRLINPFAPGGSPDILARAMAPHVQQMLGQPMVVENRPGAGGMVGARYAAQQPADGHAVFLAAISAVLAPFMAREPGYRIEDFRPVSILTVTPLVLVVRENFPAQNVAEWDRALRANPGRFTYATAGIGTPHQMAAELYANLTGAQITHVPYRGTAPALTDIRAGTVDFMFADLAAALGQIRQGGLRALAVTTNRRVPAIADVPMMGDTILPGFEAYSFVSWWVPARTPDAAVRRLNQVALHALGQADVQARIQEFGFLAEGTSADRAQQFVATEGAKWSALIRARNLRFEEG
ncbi:tripartite tricarboxylate transporter substrate binding protein [Roseococcus sp. SDR]|uniref:Bug family tripartite tricarboxylate transporter substrate binding protein n=1 Tax=Roseococcus sp. SDR TaxID=2835532 RepID=UPI001BCFB9DF|nr:tripartite tricarboxylate transporter substrate binding protein [Roseococcus sp. SDR]MBS7789458.1 tripartite tricarboxylate transporter substrate binding protein [Roseococcus sp. SDR]MBV1844772.1 tripartite tricarboxylate transporter substrate binding protein [Roseococcus sp. SDR]